MSQIFVTDYFGIKFSLFPVACLQMRGNVTHLEVGYPGLMLWVKWVNQITILHKFF